MPVRQYAKKLPIEPGEYACTWKLGGHDFDGSVKLAPSAEPEGMIYGVVPHAPGFEFTVEDDREVYYDRSLNPWCRRLLAGQLRSGPGIVLYEVHFRPGMNYDASLIANIAVCGPLLSFHDFEEFPGLTVQVGGLDRLAGGGPLRPISSPKQLIPADSTFQVEWNQSALLRWHTDQGVTLTVDYSVDHETASPYSYHITPYPLVDVDGDSKTPREWIDRYVTPIRQLAELSSATPQPITYVLLRYQTHSPLGTSRHEAQVFGSDITQEKRPSVGPEFGDAALIDCGTEGYSLPDLIKGILELADEHSVFFELFTSSFRRRLPLRSAFLVLLPALESLHTSRVALGPHSHEEQKRRKKAVIDEARRRRLPSKYIRWLRTSFDQRGDYSLPFRLRALHLNLPSSFRIALDAEKYRKRTPKSEIEGDVWQVVTRARNDLAHGGRLWSDEDLYPLYVLVRTLAIALLLESVTGSTVTLEKQLMSGH